MIKKKKILIVGGTGFIGFHLSLQCIKKNWQVVSLSTKKPIWKRKIAKVKYLICDISSSKNIKKKIANFKFDYVVNLGGYVDHSNKSKVYKSHFIGCKNLADFFRRKNIKSFIQIGTGLEYGNKPYLHNELLDCKPKSIYAKSKYKASKYLLNLFIKKKFPITILRLYQAYGPYQDPNRLIPSVIQSCLKEKKFACTNGNQIRDFIYIDDLIRLFFLIFDNNQARGKIFNIGSGERVKIKNLIMKIVKLCKSGKPVYGSLKMRKDESLMMCPDMKLVKKILKFKKKIALKKGLFKTIAYFKKYY